MFVLWFGLDSFQSASRGGAEGGGVVVREKGGGADWVTPIPTYDSRAEAETPYRIHHGRTVPYSLYGPLCELTKLTTTTTRAKHRSPVVYVLFTM